MRQRAMWKVKGKAFSPCSVITIRMTRIINEGFLTLKALGFFLTVQHWGGGGGAAPPPSKIRSRHPRKLKFTGMIAYVVQNK